MNLKRIEALLPACLLAFLMAATILPASAETTAVQTVSTSSAATTTAEAPESVCIVHEPGETSNGVYFYRKNNKVSAESFSWETGRNGGMALRLNGVDQYLRLSTATVKELDSFSLSAWVKWAGNPTDAEAADVPLFTFYKNENRYISVFPEKVDLEKQINGLYMTWVDKDFEPIELYKPADEKTSFSLPADEWHHLVLTASDTVFTLYVDGIPFLHKDMAVKFRDIDMRTFKIGTNFNNSAFLDVLLDDAYFYPTALTDDQVLLLAVDRLPITDGPVKTKSETTVTRPSVNITETDTIPEYETTVLGLPKGLFYFLVFAVAIIVGLSVWLSFLGKQGGNN